MLTNLLALNGGARPTVSQFVQHPFFTDDNYFDIMDKTAPSPPDQVTPAETGENVPLAENTPPEEGTQPEQEFLPEEVTSPVISTPAKIDTPAEEDALSEQNTQPGENKPLEIIPMPKVNFPSDEDTLSEVNTPSEIGVASKEIGHPEVCPLSDENTTAGIIVPDEMHSLEEALPEEYAVTQRKPLLNENGLKSTTAFSGISEENLNGKIDQQNLPESWEGGYGNEVKCCM